MPSLEEVSDLRREALGLVKQQCAVCSAPGFLKCEECRARRYCGQACQERDEQEGHLISCQETARERRVGAAVMDRVVEDMFQVGEGLPHQKRSYPLLDLSLLRPSK